MASWLLPHMVVNMAQQKSIFSFFKNIKLNLMSSKAWSLYMWEANMLITGSIRKLQRQSFDSSQTWNQR